MNDWCKEHHGKSGLAQRVRESVLTMEEAEDQVLEFVSRYVNENGAQLAVRSVATMLKPVSCNAGWWGAFTGGLHICTRLGVLEGV